MFCFLTGIFDPIFGLFGGGGVGGRDNGGRDNGGRVNGGGYGGGGVEIIIMVEGIVKEV